MSFIRWSMIAALMLPAARAAEPVNILPDESLKGWSRIPIPAMDGLKGKPQWRVDAAQGTLICTGEGQHEWLRYDTPAGDFVFEVDWRFTPKGDVKYNSGIGIRLSPWGEIWAQAQTGPSGGFLFGQNLAGGSLQRFHTLKEMKENRVKPAGEWNHYEIRAEGDRITLSVNGAVVSETNGYGLRKGYIGLEAEGYEITFRNLKLQTLN